MRAHLEWQRCCLDLLHNIAKRQCKEAYGVTLKSLWTMVADFSVWISELAACHMFCAACRMNVLRHENKRPVAVSIFLLWSPHLPSLYRMSSNVVWTASRAAVSSPATHIPLSWRKVLTAEEARKYRLDWRHYQQRYWFITDQQAAGHIHDGRKGSCHRQVSDTM